MKLTPVILLILVSTILPRCFNPVNKKTSEIGDLDYTCPTGSHDMILEKYSTEGITDSLFISKLEEIASMPFESNPLYFESGPKEIIAIDVDWYSVRYVFNPEISKIAQDGLSSSLTESEKERIMTRIYGVLEECGCKENK